MSIQGQRQEIADALSTVEGVQGSKSRPRLVQAGSAWPLGPLMERASQVPAFEVSWQIWVILPGREQEAIEWFDEHHEAIAEALEEFGYVTRIEPGTVDTEKGDREAMVLTVRREAH